jgi:hypothetical protein
MSLLINKNGLEIEYSARPVREELLNGTGAVMGEGCSIFMENDNVRDQQFVVAYFPDSREKPERSVFTVEQFGKAWELFCRWNQTDS